MPVAESQLIGVDIHCRFERANDFLAVPQNFPQWASGLGGSLSRVGGAWIAQTPDGPMEVRFTPPNSFGVADHVVIPPGGAAPIPVPLRVIRNGDGCTVMLTLFRLPGMSDDRLAADAAWVRRDFAKLKKILEGEPASA